MKFARYVFGMAALYGMVAVFPLYFSEQTFAVQFPPPLNHPEYFYSFISVTLAWQIFFIFIAMDPVRYQVLMIPCIIEKLSLLPTFFILYPHGRFPLYWIPLLLIDLGFGLLFSIAFGKVRRKKLSNIVSL